MTSQETGHRAEQAALDYLLTHGFTLVRRNFSCKMGEIDLILKDSKTLIFVEVRLRHNPYYGSGAESVTFKKRRKIINTAQFFLLKFPLQGNLDCRFDVISMDGKIEWIKNAFTLD